MVNEPRTTALSSSSPETHAFQYNNAVPPLDPHDVGQFTYDLLQIAAEALHPETVRPSSEALILRKLQLVDQTLPHVVGVLDVEVSGPDHQIVESSAASLDLDDTSTIVDDTLAALMAIKSTPYDSSFASRLLGGHAPSTVGLMSVDWDAQSDWMDLMQEIREHYNLAHRDKSKAEEIEAPIHYVCMQPEHLPQIHDLLSKTFWSDIDVRDSLRYSPEQCTVVATYKRLVVGVAILSSPDETYLTYIAVRSGWENVRIATTMLYHLIHLNPHKDITLHVSANSPVMILYNRFGFKAEQFIAGFYDAYMDPRSRASKNAFRLRLRR